MLRSLVFGVFAALILFTTAGIQPARADGDCVASCKTRYGDGTCAFYGDDYCGQPRHRWQEPRCVFRCKSYYGDGTCAFSDSDFCGLNAQCSKRCEMRYGDGSCASYGADYCRSDD